MTARLPIPGSDDGTWGAVLNSYLSQSLDSSGNLNANTVGAAQVADGALPEAKIQNLTTNLASKVDSSSVGVAGGVAALTSAGHIPQTQLPTSTSISYPISEYGFFAASSAIENFTAKSTLGSLYFVRLFIPAGQVISAIATVVTDVGTLGAGGGNCFCIYDNNGTFIAQTPTDDTLWQSAGWRIGQLSTPIAAQNTDRFIYASAFVVGYSSPPYIGYATPSTSNAFLAGGYNKPNHRRAFYANGVASLPASFDPTSYGNLSNYLPLIALG
jgi:hypothetical protein